MPSKNKVDINIHVDKEVKEKLQAYADALVVSVNWLAVRAITQFLAELPPVEEVVLKLTKD